MNQLKNEDQLRFIISVAAGTLLTAIGIVVFIAFTGRLFTGNLDSLDISVSSYFYSLRSEWLTVVFKGITFLGSAPAYFLQLPVVFILVYRANKKIRKPIQAAVILISSFLLNLLLKYYYGRLRPDESFRLVEISSDSLSYPSGHSMTAMAYYGFIIYLLDHYMIKTTHKLLLKASLVAVILSIGVSRIYLGAHYPSDVIAGFIAGLVWLIIILTFTRFSKQVVRP